MIKISQRIVIKIWKPIFETMCNQSRIKRIYTRAYQFQTSDKVEVF